MKKSILLVSLLISLFCFSQIPTNYYSSARGKIDDNLKYELNQIIDNHIEFSYTSTNTDVWDILKETDKDPSNSSNVILNYSGVSVDALQEYNSGNGWTREHVWAKSRGDFGTTQGPGTDAHALRPLDAQTNTIRNNRGFDNCTDCIDVYDTWSNNTGSKRDNTEWSFEPRDEVKGDVARMLFYMAVRYDGGDGYIDLELSETILGTSDQSPSHGRLSTLLDWHRNDPVDDWERNRNDVIYYDYQNNRNPFIDHPEIAEYLWGNQIGNTWSDIILDIEHINENPIRVFLDKTLDTLNINELKDTVIVNVYNILGILFVSKTVTQYENTIAVSQLERGIYIIRLSNNETLIVKKVVIF